MVSGALIIEPLNSVGDGLKNDSTVGLLSFPLLGVFGTKMQRDCTRMTCHKQLILYALRRAPFGINCRTQSPDYQQA